jgi:hypothetical protein
MKWSAEELADFTDDCKREEAERLRDEEDEEMENIKEWDEVMARLKKMANAPRVDMVAVAKKAVGL